MSEGYSYRSLDYKFYGQRRFNFECYGQEELKNFLIFYEDGKCDDMVNKREDLVHFKSTEKSPFRVENELMDMLRERIDGKGNLVIIDHPVYPYFLNHS